MTDERACAAICDVGIIGAGFSGLYALYALRQSGWSVKVFEAGSDVGGTWYWNRYPGARCDSPSIYYHYTFSEELLEDWTWSSRFPEQQEVYAYLRFVAERLDLARNIQFDTRVDSAHYDESSRRWILTTSDGAQTSVQILVSAVGCLSAVNAPNIKGLAQFKGDYYHTGRWPHTLVDFTGKRVGVIGTGSSGVQAIPVIAAAAEHLTVFQRTPQYSLPARNHQFSPEYLRSVKDRYPELNALSRVSYGGIPNQARDRSALADSPAERHRSFQDAWDEGGHAILLTYNDLTIDSDSNGTISQFIRDKIAEIVDDKEIAARLMPNYYYATKRPIIDTSYYETYNRDNVTLVNLRATPIEEVRSGSLRTTDADYPIDMLVLATGYDGITGPLFRMDLRGIGGERLTDKWANGSNIKTYLGLTTAGFPNLFMITGPESPSVMTNMPVAIEQHVEWIDRCLYDLRVGGWATIEASPQAESEWSDHCRELAAKTLYSQTPSWWNGANIEGKPEGFPVYVGGIGSYRQRCDTVRDRDYEGFIRRRP